MPLLPLADLHARLDAAAAAGDAETAWSTLHALVGLVPRRPAPPLPPHSDVPAVRHLVYAEPRRIDIAALLSGARDVAKFEDLSAARATALETEFAGRGLKTVRVGPYSKQFTLSVSTDAPTQEVELFTVIASKAGQADAVAEAERDRSEAGTRAAGRALGYPECCVEHFVELSKSPMAGKWGVNEAAIRSWPVSTDLVPWQMNPLSSMSPVGFTACSPTCPHAFAFAERLLAGLARLDPRGRETIRNVLARPILFFRYPLFWVLDGTPFYGPVMSAKYKRAALNDDGSGGSKTLHSIAFSEFGLMLAAGNEVELASDGMVVRTNGAKVARWDYADRNVPRLFRFRPTD